jgi:hypothetical protein
MDQRLTPRVWATPEYDRTVFIVRMSQYVMKLDCKAVKMSNVKRTEISMECVVKQAVVDGKIDGWKCLRCLGRRLWSRLRARRFLRWRPAFFAHVREGRIVIWCMGIRCQVQAI